MRYLAWTVLPFCGAVFLGCKLPHGWLCWSLGALCLVLGIAAVLREHPRRVQRALLALGACLGFVWFGLYTAVAVEPVNAMDGKESAFTATVASYPSEESWGTSVFLRMDSGLGEGARVYAMLDGTYSALKPGDQLTGTACFEAPAAQQGGSSDTSRGIFLTAWVEVERVYAVPSVPLRYFPARLGRALKQTIASLFPGEEGGLLQGLLTGDKSGLSDGIYSAFRRTGMAHLLAVSGLHVGFLTGILYLLPGQKRRRVLIAIPVLICFALMTGGQSSVWRAVVMAAMLLLAPMFGRESDPITSLSFALLLLLLQNPYASENVGLQLSFAAVAGLACFNTKLYDWMVKPLKTARTPSGIVRLCSRGWKVVAASLSTSLSACVFTLPLVAWYFRTVSLVGPLANLLCIWAASLAFGLGFIACAAAWISPGLAGVLAAPAKWLLGYLMAVARGLSQGAFVSLRLDNLYYIGWFLGLMALVLLLIAVKPLRRRPILPIASVVLLLFLALDLRMTSLTAPALTVTALDVGQGSCTVFGSGGTFAAVDCGGTDAGDLLADHIQSAGGDTLSLLVLTHYDRDHTSGVEQLLERIRVTTAALSPVAPDEELLYLLEANGCEVIFIDSNTDVSFGQASLRVMPPVAEETDNGACLSVLCSWQERHILVTGDLDGEGERLLLEREELPELDVLIVGHHGSASSTCAQLLAALKPECALISVGENQYRMPSPEVLDRLDAYGCAIYRTDRNGTVTIRYH